MSKVAVGSIPEKICYVSSDEREVPVGCAWDISWYDDSNTVKVKVLPAFPTDSTDEKMLKRAKQWAEQSYYGQPQKVSKADTVDNKPIKDVKILSLEERGNGGRAYKAVIDKYYVDLREDVLMDTLLKAGVSVGGVLQGEFVWAKMGAQMKLVRVGSELHRLITEFESKKDIKPIGKGDLEVGGVYQDRKKNKAIFVGYINTCILKPEDKEPDYFGKQKAGSVASFKYKKSNVKKAVLFYEIPIYMSQKDALAGMKNKEKDYAYKIKKSHTYIEKVDQVKIPNGIVEFLRDKAVKQAKEHLLEYVGKKDPAKNVQRIDSWYLQSTIAYNSEHLNMYPFGATPVETFDVKKLLVFS